MSNVVRKGTVVPPSRPLPKLKPPPPRDNTPMKQEVAELVTRAEDTFEQIQADDTNRQNELVAVSKHFALDFPLISSICLAILQETIQRSALAQRET